MHSSIAFSISSSDTDKLTADATNEAFEGNHNVVVNQLATSERWVHSTGKEYAEDYVGAGTFIYSYNNTETTITTTATTTLSDMVGLINNDANNPGVTASLLYYNNAYHLVMNGNDAGSDYRISVNASNTEVWKADIAFTVSSDDEINKFNSDYPPPIIIRVKPGFTLDSRWYFQDQREGIYGMEPSDRVVPLIITISTENLLSV